MISSGRRAIGRGRIYDVVKRGIDILVGGGLLLLLSPGLLLIAVLIRVTTRGPALFRQVRIGRGNRVFQIFKFRTMYLEAERSGPLITSSDDDRITPLGRKLRATKLDEFPQLINVLRGEMSLVGPRPQVPRFVERFPAEQRDIVLAVRPGITGPTQIRFRREEEMLEGRVDREQYYFDVLLPVKCKLDVEYVHRRSMLLDAGVVAQTAVIFAHSMIMRLRHRVVRRSDHAVVTARPAHVEEEKADAIA